jgi:hypothetical protein
MRIIDTFRNDISRRIEEVVKVDVTDADIVAEEIGEYVVTNRIEESLHDVIDAYRESISNPSGLTNVWVSGFFGSGKSSFAKVLGYLLENRQVGERSTAELFFPRCNDPRIPALLKASWELAPAVTVFLELSSSRDVRNEAEGIVLPMYRALLARLGYSMTPTLAALEFDLESEGRLAAFEAAYARVHGHDWQTDRDTSLAKNRASAALSDMDSDTFPSADSWSKSFEPPHLDARWFARRAIDMVERRGGGARRLVFVVDEVSQYIARSIDRITAVQAVAESFQQQRGRLWLVATGQERLEEVYEGLEGTQSELQRLRDRFPLTVDLLPSDIREVVSRRVLEKREEGRAEITRALAPHRHKLAANTRLVSETRAAPPSEEELVKLYPLVPYQVQLVIDAVSKRRSQVRSSAPMGGSARTVIKHAQQLVTSGRVGLGKEDVGALVTADRSYDLLEEVIPGPWRDEIRQVSDKYQEGSTEVAVMKAIALVHDVGALPLTAHNLAVLLHPAISAESRRDEVTAALGRLAADDRIRETDQGFALQSAEQKRWDQERRDISLGLGDELRLHKRVLTDALKGLTVTQRRSFGVGITVDGEQRSTGEVVLEVVSSNHAGHRDDIRARSREGANANRIYWVFDRSDQTWEELEELHRSDRMIERHDVASKTPADVQQLADEKNRHSRAERRASAQLAHDLSKGEVIFHGLSEPAPGGELRAGAQAIVKARLCAIYPQLDHFAAAVEAKDVAHLLRADDLASVTDSLGDAGIGLVTMTSSGAKLVTEADPLAGFLAEVRRRCEYGAAPTGAVLERHFADPPYGAPVGVVQALTAAALRAGLVEVVHNGQRIANANDHRLEAAFRTLPAFRQIEVRPPRDTGPDNATRSRLARRLHERTGEPQSPSVDALARAVRVELVAASAETVIEVTSTLAGAGLVVPSPVRRARELLNRLKVADDAEVIQTAAGSWEDLVAGLEAVDALAPLLASDLAVYVSAKELVASELGDLGEKVGRDRARLAELLAAADYVSHAGEIRELVAGIEAAAAALHEKLSAELAAAVDAELGLLAERFGDVAERDRDTILDRLATLAPADHAVAASSPGVGRASRESLRGALGRISPVAAEARRELEALRCAGRMVDVRVAELVTDPLADVAALDGALAAIRRAVEAQLGDAKVVRLT